METNISYTYEVPAEWSLKPAAHEDKAVILIQFEYSTDLNRRVRTVPGARWSRTLKSWFVSDTPTNRRLLGLAADPVGKEALSHIHPINKGALHRLIETLQLKAYSESTIRTYRNEFAQLVYVLKATPVDSLDAERLRSYFLYCTTTLKLSENTLHSRINAVKFYYEQVLHRERFFFEIPRPKKHQQIPNVFSVQDVKGILMQNHNLKHQTILMMCYASGLRVSEVVALRIADIDSHRMVIYIRRAKGKKDRVVPLSEVLLQKLRNYFMRYKPGNYLFEGQYDGEQYTPRSVQ